LLGTEPPPEPVVGLLDLRFVAQGHLDQSLLQGLSPFTPASADAELQDAARPRGDAGGSLPISYFEVLVVRSKGHVVVGLAEAHADAPRHSADGHPEPLSLVSRAKLKWLSQPDSVALGGSITGLLPDGVGLQVARHRRRQRFTGEHASILTIDAVALQAPAAALGLLAPGEVIGCGGVWRAGSTGERESLEIFFLRDGLPSRLPRHRRPGGCGSSRWPAERGRAHVGR
jgi:hypothetical protein